MAKQGTNFPLHVEVKVDVSAVEKIEFMLMQGRNWKYVVYPSDDVTYDPNAKDFVIPISMEESYRFLPDVPIVLDTRITLTDSPFNPHTEAVTFMMDPTLFKKEQR